MRYVPLISFSSSPQVKKPESGILYDWSWPAWQAFEREGKGDLGHKRNARGMRGRTEGNACQEAIVFPTPPTNYVCKNNATVMHFIFLAVFLLLFFFCFPKTRNLK